MPSARQSSFLALGGGGRYFEISSIFLIFEIKIKIEKIYIGEKIIFLEFIFFYLLIPLMGHYNGPKKCYGVKLGGGGLGDPP